MTSQLVRSRMITTVRNAIAEYKLADRLTHSLLKGRVREIALDRLLRPIVPLGIGLGTGIIADHQGRQSHETDVVVFDPRLLAPVLFDQRFGVFPIDACLNAIEVKSRLDAGEIRDAIVKAKALGSMMLLPVQHSIGSPAPGSARLQIDGQPLGVTTGLFAFSSDLEGGGKTELDRYLEYDEAGPEGPAVRTICVLGHGFWMFRQDLRTWTFHPATPEHDEVIDFLSVLVNSLMPISASRGWPALGVYAIELRDYSSRNADGSWSVKHAGQ